MEVYKNKSLLSLLNEEWVDTVGFDGYLVSNLGRVKNKTGAVLSQTFCRDYLILGLTRVVDGKKERKTVRVHRMVAISFIKNDNPLQNTVNHKNNIKTDNRVVNLEWATYSENKRSSFKLGHNKRKLTPANIIEIRTMSKKGMTQIEIAKRFNVLQPIISDIINGKKWSYVE